MDQNDVEEGEVSQRNYIFSPDSINETEEERSRPKFDLNKEALLHDRIYSSEGNQENELSPIKEQKEESEKERHLSFRDLSMNISMEDLEMRFPTKNSKTSQKTGFSRPKGLKSKIVPGERLSGLKEFYLREKKTVDSLVKEDLKRKGMSEELQAQWAIDQFRNAALHFHLLDIIDEKEPIPRIPDAEEYINAFALESEGKMKLYEESMEKKVEFIQSLDDLKKQLKKKSQRSLSEDMQFEFTQKIMLVMKEIRQEEDSMDKMKNEIREIAINIRKYALKQRDLDEDALGRMNEAMNSLRKFLSDLIKKVPYIENAVRWKGKDGSSTDPYEDRNLIRVMKNLNHHFRNTKGLGKTTLLLSGFREPQGNKSSGQHLMLIEGWLAAMKSVNIKSISVEEFAALVALATAKEELKHGFIEAEAQLAQTMSSIEIQSQSGPIQEKSIFQRLQAYVSNLDQKDTIGSRLKAKPEREEVNTKKTRSNSPERRDEDVLAVEQSFHDRNCPFLKRNGRCTHGKACSYNSESKRAPVGICRYYASGNCYKGDQCIFKHVGGQEKVERQPQNPKSVKSETTSEKKSSNTLDFSGLKNGGQNGWCVISEESPESVNSVIGKKMNIGWDTMASINVVSDLSLLTEVKELEKKSKVVGLGGEREITHEGICEAFGGIKMKYIPGGMTPNLLSIAEALKANEDGIEGLALMTSAGAIKFRAYPKVLKAVQEIVDALIEHDLIEGKAQVVNGVYKQFCEGDLDEDEAYAVTSMYANRVPLTSAAQALVMLSSAGATEEALLKGVREKTIKGLPEGVTEAEVRRFFSTVGKDVEQLRAEVIHAPLREPIDYQEDIANDPGEILIIDACDPSFSRMERGKGPLRSIGGYRDVVVAVDKVSGVVDIIGRKSPKEPHKTVEIFIKKWMGRWKNLKMVKADQAFVTKETSDICEGLGVILRQAVPGEHRRGTGEVEGAIRWLQDQGQCNMNRVLKVARSGEVIGFGEKEARRLWFHCLRHAVFASHMKPTLNGTKTRYEERYGVVFNLSNVVMLPFGLPMVVRRRIADNEGRGSIALYLGPSSVVKAGILTYVVQSGRIQQKYSFIPREKLPLLEDIDVAEVAGNLYGRIAESGSENQVQSDALSQLIEDPDEEYGNRWIGQEDEQKESEEVECDDDVAVEGSQQVLDENIAQDELESDQEDLNESDDATNLQSPSGGNQNKKVKRGRKTSPNMQKRNTNTIEMQALTKPIQHQLQHLYNTRSKNMVMAIQERPPKPPIPKKSEAMERPEWKKAMERELEKINQEETIYELPKGEDGEYIMPTDPIVMRMFEILDYKWKVDPETGQERWLEVIRAVVDGSTDKRTDGCYAETPDRSILLMMLSIGATIGERSVTGDAVRAYLNAEALDPNLVVIATPHMKLLPRMGILNKGLYGTLKGALGWEVWVEKKLLDVNGFTKCVIPRSIYIKEENGCIARLLRHSDDFRLSSISKDVVKSISKNISESIRMSEWVECERFLGLTIEYLRKDDGNFEDGNNICVVRCTDKINDMESKFNYLIQRYNQKRLKRKVPLPLEFFKNDEDLEVELRNELNDQQKKEYMSLIGSIGYIAVSLRFDIRFAYMVLAKRLSQPRHWDFFLATWTMEYLVGTKHLPLILGGPDINFECYSDASFAIMEERKSVKAHLARTNNLSGAFFATASTIKNTVNSVWEAEVNAASDGIDTFIYAKNVCEDLRYPWMGDKIFIDNRSTIHWLEGENVSSTSKHVETRIFRMRQIIKTGMLNLEYIETENNVADILTKSLSATRFKKLRQVLMGHLLVKGMKVQGVEEQLTDQDRTLN